MRHRPRGGVARAAAAVEAGETADGLRLAVEAWRGARAPGLADAIDALGALLPGGDDAHLPRVGSPAHEAWWEEARRGDPVDFARFARTLQGRSADSVRTQIAILAQLRPADPRLATYLLAQLETTPRARGGWWRHVMEILGTQVADPRSIPRLEAILARLRGLATPSTALYSRARIADAIAALRAQFPTDPVVDRTALADLIAAIAARAAADAAATARGRELLAEIYARPADDAPRAVYADWLQRRDEPRGELIALQLGPATPASTWRVRALLAAHGITWLGALAPVVVASRSRYTRGFLGHATVLGSNVHLRAAAGAPEWATIEALRVRARACDDGVAAIVLHPVMRALRELTLDRVPPELLGDAPGLPRLDRLAVTGQDLRRGACAPIAQLLAAPIAAPLRELAVATRAVALTVVRGGSGALDRLRVHPAGRDPAALARAGEQVARLARAVPAVAEVEIAASARAHRRLTAAHLEALLGPLADLPRRYVSAASRATP